MLYIMRLLAICISRERSRLLVVFSDPRQLSVVVTLTVDLGDLESIYFTEKKNIYKEETGSFFYELAQHGRNVRLANRQNICTLISFEVVHSFLCLFILPRVLARN